MKSGLVSVADDNIHRPLFARTFYMNALSNLNGILSSLYSPMERKRIACN
uniref:Uncharacterized protein n=1 Tax=Magallana gigas TaxID=29159 RepID=K1Q5D7_MAGGI